MLKFIEYGAIFFNVVYLILAIRMSVWCWIFGIVGVLLSFYVYTHESVKLYSDASLQVVYLGLSVYGWISWKHQNDNESQFTVRRMSLLYHVAVILIGIVTTFLLGTFWTYFGASLPYLDAATTSFAIITTILVVRRYIENWIYWIVIDIVCAIMYFYKGIEGFGILFIIYAVMAIWGYRNWHKRAAII